MQQNTVAGARIRRIGVGGIDANNGLESRRRFEAPVAPVPAEDYSSLARSPRPVGRERPRGEQRDVGAAKSGERQSGNRRWRRYRSTRLVSETCREQQRD